MIDFEHQKYGIGFAITGKDYNHPEHMKMFKQYTRNGKVFWRNYNRNVKGGVSMVELFELMREKSAAAIIENLTR